MIVATAGHIDHGKTALVTALTGVDTDRLPEEKRRGMTIDLGFAYWRGNNDAVLGFVDVPGHDRFVHTMVAGVGAVDYALLVVAADDGIMPQTREHLSILSLLGIRRGAIVVSKSDKSEPGRATVIADAVRAMAPDDVWSSAPHFAVSSLSGEGIAPFLRHLADQAGRIDGRRPTHSFRMTADRVFTIEGAGLVVSGAVIAGQIARGDHIVVSPAGVSARVRRVHANNRESDVAVAGDRCALNLVVEKNGAVRRGDWLVAPDISAPSCRFDAHLLILETATKPFRNGTKIHLHVGTTDVTARVDVLSRGSLAPGESGMVQIVTERSVDVLCSDRFIIRDRSATVTLGGGLVIDPWPAVRGRARPERLAILDAMAGPSPLVAFSRLLTVSEQGIDWDAFRHAWNLTGGTANAILARESVVEIKTAKARIMLAHDKWVSLSRGIAEVISQWHAERPDEIGPSQRDVEARLAKHSHPALLDAAIEKLVQAGAIVRSRARLRHPEHEPALPPAERKLWERLSALYSDAQAKPPTIHEIATQLLVARSELEKFLEGMARRGYLIRVSETRYFMPSQIRKLLELASDLAHETHDGAFAAAAYRDRCNLGRNLTIEVLEYFDRAGFTQLAGVKRRIRGKLAFVDA